MIHHASFEVPSALVEQEASFWELLGWRRIESPAGLAGLSVWLERDGQQVHLILEDPAVVPRTGHVALVLGDSLHPVLEALRGAGIDADERERLWGAERWYARTPAGHVVELMAAPP